MGKQRKARREFAVCNNFNKSGNGTYPDQQNKYSKSMTIILNIRNDAILYRHVFFVKNKKSFSPTRTKSLPTGLNAFVNTEYIITIQIVYIGYVMTKCPGNVLFLLHESHSLIR